MTARPDGGAQHRRCRGKIQNSTGHVATGRRTQHHAITETDAQSTASAHETAGFFVNSTTQHDWIWIGRRKIRFIRTAILDFSLHNQLFGVLDKRQMCASFLARLY